MKRRSLVWKIYPTYLFIILISIIAVSGLAITALKHIYMNQVAADLKARLLLAETEVTHQFEKGKAGDIDSVCKSLGQRVDTRFTVILPDGKVVGDTRKDPATMDNHADRPEVVAARTREWGQSTRYSYTLKQRLIYVAHTISHQGRLVAVMRAALPVPMLDRILGGIYKKILFGGILIAGLAALICFFVAKKIAYPIREMTQVVQQFSRGNLEERVPPQKTRELSLLSEAMNEMAAHLRETIETVIRQKQELEVILSGMSEGVVAVDLNDAVISINKRASALFAVDQEKVTGKSFYEIIRNSRLQAFIKKALETQEPLEMTIPFGEEGEMQLQLHGAQLKGEGDRKIGAVIVMNDVTRLRRLEIVRRDFVANVSHELKTPITAIRGAIETLQEVALKRPSDARRFLSMLSRQVEKLSAIIEDLLRLARIEQGIEKANIPFGEVSLSAVVGRSVDGFRGAAEKAKIGLKFYAENDITLLANANLLEQAVGNLVDNAIKYTPEGGEVTVEVRKIGQEAAVSVKDTGVGIPESSIPRIFERFYRADKSRNRKLGGTGLGLSLVRHIMNVHKGRVEVKSREGKGSIFILIFPLPD